MPGNISQFLEHVKDSGIAKTSHFDVEIMMGDADVSRLLKLRCDAAELPGRQIATTDNKIYGPIYKTPYQTLYSEITLTFVETADMQIRNFFEMWANSIYDAQTNVIGFIDEVVADIFVTQYDVDGTSDQLNPTLKFQLIRAFPTNINQMTTSWADDAPHKLSITFFYERYVIFQLNDRERPTISEVEFLATNSVAEGKGREQEALGRAIIQTGIAKQTANNLDAEEKGRKQQALGQSIIGPLVAVPGPVAEGRGREQEALGQMIVQKSKAASEAQRTARSDGGLLTQIVNDLKNKVFNSK